MATTSFILQKHGVLHTDSQDTIRERVAHYLCPHHMRLFDGQPLSSKMSAISFDQLSIIELQYGADVEIDPEAESNVYLFRVTLEGQGKIVYPDQKIDMVRGGVTVSSPCQRALIQTTQHCHNIIMRIPRHRLEQRLAHRLQQPISFPLIFEHYAPSYSPATDFLLNTIRYFASLSDFHLHSSTAAEQLKRMEDYLYDSLLGLFKHNYSQRLQLDTSLLPRHVKKAKQYMDQHLSQEITLETLAHHAQVSTRTLQYGFQRFVGLSPKAYLIQQRMQSVHETLVNARPGTRVTDIVLQHGINNPGHFASRYKKVYGITPVQTLYTNDHHTA
ncbi:MULTISPECIES: AraC family transcriptional regulator [unclassified Halomonas]|uniref:AraC family transcriptional regulator n=1 Tax=unclassified Halomonas TaxID=2609666 RepID=UPI002076798E|nr:AraC family transcriptional regulator [Halomonas sp. S3-1-8]